MGRSRGIGFTLGALALALAMPCASAAARTIEPDTFANTDSASLCSLRSAVIAANTDAPKGGCPAGSGGDVIELKAGTYNVGGGGAPDDTAVAGDLDILSELTIEGPTDGTATIDAQYYDRVFDVLGSSAKATLSNLVIQHGEPNTGGDGGNIRVNGGGTLILQDSLVRRASGTEGGGIWLGADSTGIVTRSTIADNDASGDGGGIAVTAAGANLLLIDSTLLRNTADDNGGGVNVMGTGTATIRNTTIYNNFAFHGGGVYTENAGSAVTLDNVTVSDNFASDGGGIYQSTGTTVTGRGALVADNVAGDGAPDCTSVHLGRLQPDRRHGLVHDQRARGQRHHRHRRPRAVARQQRRPDLDRRLRRREPGPRRRAAGCPGR